MPPLQSLSSDEPGISFARRHGSVPGQLTWQEAHKKTIIRTPNAGLQNPSDPVDQGKSLTPVGKIDILADFVGGTAALCVINVHFGVKSAEALFNLHKQLFLREDGSVSLRISPCRVQMNLF